jgi:hypothetical protein
MIALRDGRVVAHIGGLRSRTWIDGAERTFTQVVDAFTLPESTAGLARGKLFVRTAEAYFARCDERDELTYGWPTPEHARLGARTLGYQRVRGEVLLATELRRGASRACSAERITSFDANARWLWERCASEWGASTIRDERWLSWRYLERPRSRYVLLGLRDANANLAALAVLAPPSFLGPEVWLVVDWLVPSGEQALGRELLECIETAAEDHGARGVATLLPAWSPWFQRFQEAGWRAHESRLELYCRGFARRLDALFLDRSWWFQLSDSDLV